MSLDLFQTDNRDAINGAERNTAPLLPAGFKESFDTAWDNAVLFGQSFAFVNARNRAMDDLFQQAYDTTRDERFRQDTVAFGNRFRGADGGHSRKTKLDVYNEIAAEHAAEGPEREATGFAPSSVRPITPEQLDVHAADLSKDAREAYKTMAARQGGGFGTFAGSAAGGMADPINVLTFPLAAPEALGIIKTGLTWAGIGAGTQTAIEAIGSPYREKVDPDYARSGEAAHNVLEAGAFAGTLGATIKALGTGWRWYANKSQVPRTIRDAGNVLDSETQVAETNPLRGPEGETAHREALSKTFDDVIKGDVPNVDGIITPGMMEGYQSRLTPVMKARAAAIEASNQAALLAREDARLPGTMERLSEMQLGEIRGAVDALDTGLATRVTDLTEQVTKAQAAVEKQNAVIEDLRAKAVAAPDDAKLATRLEVAQGKLEKLAAIAEQRAGALPLRQVTAEARAATRKGRATAEMTKALTRLAEDGYGLKLEPAEIASMAERILKAPADDLEVALRETTEALVEKARAQRALAPPTPFGEARPHEEQAALALRVTNIMRMRVQTLAREVGYAMPKEEAGAIAARLLEVKEPDALAILDELVLRPRTLAKTMAEPRPTVPEGIPTPPAAATPPAPAAEAPAAISKVTFEGAPRADYVDKIGSGEHQLPTVADLTSTIKATEDAEKKYYMRHGLTEEEYKRLGTLDRTIDNAGGERADAAIVEKNAILAKLPEETKTHEFDLPDQATLKQLRGEFEALERSAGETAAEHLDGMSRVLKRYINDVMDGDPFARAIFRKAMDEARKAGFDTKQLTNDTMRRLFGDLSESDQAFMRQEFENFMRPKVEAPLPPVPGWLQHVRQEAVDFANQIGVTDQIQRMAAEGRTAAEISTALGERLSVDEVRAVRDSLGIAPAGPQAGIGLGVMPAYERAVAEQLTPANVEKLRTDPEMAQTVERDLQRMRAETPDKEIPVGVDKDGAPITRTVEEAATDVEQRKALAEEIKASCGPQPDAEGDGTATPEPATARAAPLVAPPPRQMSAPQAALERPAIVEPPPAAVAPAPPRPPLVHTADVGLSGGTVAGGGALIATMLSGDVAKEQTKTTTIAAQPPAAFPTEEEARLAQQQGLGYGSIAEAHIAQQVARVLGTTDKAGVFSPESGEGQTLDKLTSAATDDARSKNIDLTKPEYAGIREQLGNVFARTALAVNRIPIAALGFDPSRAGLDVEIAGEGIRVNIGGAYGPKHDAIYANLADASTLTHEFIHRGVEILRGRAAESKDKDLQSALRALPDEESVVRYLMAKQAGDPDKDGGQIDKQQRAQALALIDGNPRYQAAIEKVTAAAQQEMKRNKPRGPR